MQTNQILTLVSAFAKANKISRTKLESLVSEILAVSKPVGIGRPKLAKSALIEKRIKNAIELGINSSLEIYAILGDVPRVEFNNSLQTMKKHGIIVPTGKVNTGKQGRQPIVWSIATK